MTGIVSLFDGGIDPAAKIPHEPLVGILSDLLEKAKSGEIQGAIIAYQYHDGITSYATSVRVSSFALLGALETAKHSIFSHDNG